MPSKVTIPNTFATATTAIPLSQLDANFSNVNAAINNALTFSNYALDAGTANTYSVSITGQTTTYAAGLAIQFLALNTNTGASTLNVNAQGAKTIVNTSGAALTAGAITAGAIVSVMYDGTNFQLLNDAGTQSETFLNLTVTGTTNTANLIVTQTGATFAAGSNTAPAITTTGDTNTGIFFPAADTIAFTEGGAEAMRIDSSGNVGIGVTPSAWNSFYAGKVLQIGNSSFVSASDARSQIYANAFVNAAGNAVYLSTQGASSYTQNASGLGEHSWSTAPSGTAGNTITFTERMRIDSSGNVVIGSTSAVGRLAVYGNYAFFQENASGADVYIRGYYGNSNTAAVQVTTNSPLAFATNNTERARITSGGDFIVGANATGPYFDSRANFYSPGTYAAFGGQQAGDAGASVSVFWHTATTGNNKFADFVTEGGGAQAVRGSIDYNRGAGLTRYNTTSDATLKNIIGDADGQRSLEILNTTRLREFAWKNDPTQKPQVGVIAQELYETYKGAVSVGGNVEKERDVTEEVEEEYTDEKGNTQTRTVTKVVGKETYTEYRPWGVDKTAFTFHLIAGWQAHEKLLKEAMTRIEALEAEVAAMKAGNGN